MKKPEIENLNAQMRGIDLNIYQRADALSEFNKLLAYVEELESKNLVLPNNCKSCGRTQEDIAKMTSRCGVSACPNY